jgi:hypothetical protein
MRDECKVNRFLATDKQPKMVSEKQQQLTQLRQILNQPNMTNNDVQVLESHVQTLIADIAKLTEQKLKSNEYVNIIDATYSNQSHR